MNDELTRERWLERYKQRFIDVAGITPELAAHLATALPFEELCDMFEDDPEGAADEEMSCWTE